MRKTNKIVMAAVLSIVSLSIWANPVGIRQAQEMAAKIAKTSLKKRLTATDNILLTKVYSIQDGRPACYVFDLNPGFVIVAADDCAVPVLGYSEDGRLESDRIPIQMDVYIEGFVKQLQYGIEKGIAPTPDITAQWTSIRQTGFINGQKADRSVGPLLNSLWDQGCYYNNKCPTDSNGDCGHVAVGCVATAMGQVLHYWGYPTTGQGTHSYTPDGYATQTVNYGATTYNWSNMPNQLVASSNSSQVNAVSTLLWHCGVGVEMQYSAGSSWAYFDNVVTALQNYFRFPLGMFTEWRIDDDTWLALVKGCLNNNCPVYYCAQDDNGNGGHAFVCDGYDSNNYLHFNWGWSGEGNGYFALNALNLYGMEFNTDHYAIFNIAPDPIVLEQSVSASPSNGGTVSGGGSCYFGNTCTLNATPNNGYTFAYWTKNGNVVSSNATYSFRVTEAGAYVAVFNANSYTITASANPSDGGMVTGSGTYNYGSTCALNAVAMAGYRFVRWMKNGSQVSTNSSYSFTVTESASYVAVFELAGYTISATANPSDGGTVSGAGTYNYGSLCTLTATPNAGYAFDHWSQFGESVSTDAQYSFYVYGNVNLVANFVLAPSLPTVVIDDVNVTPYEAYIHVLATDDGGYPITELCIIMDQTTYCNSYIVDNGSWMGINNLTPSTTYYAIPLATNSQGTAYGEEVSFTTLPAETSYNVTTEVVPAGGGSVTGAGTYIHGSTCTLTAIPNEGYSVRGFYDATMNFLIQENPYVFEVTQDHHCRARFLVNTYTIMASSNLVAGGTVSGEGSYDHGTSCTLTATPNVGYTFVNWTENGTAVSSETTYSFTVTGNRSLVANFTSTHTQTTAMPEGWSWWSATVEVDGASGLAQMEESLGENGVMIKSRLNGFVSNYGNMWMGSLTSINCESTYLIQTSAACEMTLTGTVPLPSAHPISLSPGWNWIGYPLETSMSVSSALSSLTPAENDMLKSRDNGFAVYYPNFGWMGSLNTIEPGMGLMYESHSTTTQSLVYPSTSKSETMKKNATTLGNHWMPTAQPYPDNMTLLAVVKVDGDELRSEQYELGAFVGDECRGSAKMVYEPAMGRYVSYLTVYGEDPAPLHFGLYDMETGEERFDALTGLMYASHISQGAPNSPYEVCFAHTMEMYDMGIQASVFPNPVEHGQLLRVGLDAREGSPIRVEVVNELGVVVSTETSCQTPISIKAPVDSGVYVLRITVDCALPIMQRLIVY